MRKQITVTVDNGVTTALDSKLKDGYTFVNVSSVQLPWGTRLIYILEKP